MEVPDYGQYADRDWPNPEKGFAAMISRMDGDVGELMKLLKELNLDQDTVVFFTSDNGPHQEGGHQHEFFDSNGKLKGFKRSMHEGGIRVPMLVRWPGKIEPGSVNNHPSAFWDFLPTACELAGAEPPVDVESNRQDGTDGISYLPTLLGQNERQTQHEYLYWASQEGETSVGVRMGPWKLVQYRPKKSRRSKETVASESTSTPDWRLYDLRVDIGEENNVASDHPQVVEKMVGLLELDGLL